MMNLQEAIIKMEEKLAEVKLAAEEKMPQLSDENRAKLELIVERTTTVVNEAIIKVKDAAKDVTNQEELHDFLTQVVTKCNQACDFTIEKVKQFTVYSPTKEKLDKEGEKISKAFDRLLESPELQGVVDSVKIFGKSVVTEVNEFMEKPETKEKISKAKKTTLDIAEKGLDKLRDLLDEKEEGSEEIKEDEKKEEI